MHLQIQVPELLHIRPHHLSAVRLETVEALRETMDGLSM
jgi:hypothetical protein